jgi:Tfp pilus assembly ATPase PilU
MGLVASIVDFLGKVKLFSELFLIPGAPPRVREGERLYDLSDQPLKPNDTKEVLIYFRELAGKFGALDKKGVFTVSRPDFGRVRVVYGLQRGSYYLSLLKIPPTLPAMEAFFLNPAKFDRLSEVIANGRDRVYVVFGDDWFVNATLIFEVFRRILTREGKVVLTVENPPAYLLEHGKGLVVQKELYVDCKDMVSAVEDIPLMNPDFVYTFDVLNIYSLPLEEIFKYLTGGVNLFLNFPMRSVYLLRKFLRQKADPTREYTLIRVFPAGVELYDFQLESFKSEGTT